MDWITATDELILTRLEPISVPEALRYAVLKNTITEIAEKNIWFSSEVCSKRDLAVFVQSKETVELLLQHIKKPENFRVQSFCLHVISYIPCLYGLDKEVRSVLVSCYQSEDTRVYEKGAAMDAIASLNLHTDDVCKDIIKRLPENNDSYYRLGLYQYLLKANDCNEHIDILLEGLKTCQSGRQENLSEQIELNNCLDTITAPEAIEKAILWYADEDNLSINSYDRDESLEKLLTKAAKEYIRGYHSLYSAVYHLLGSGSCSVDLKELQLISQFFTETGTLKQALTDYCASEDKYKILVLERIVRIIPCAIDILCTLYIDGMMDADEFQRMATRNSDNLSFFEKCANAIKQRTGKEFDAPPPRKKYVDRRQLDTQKFFDCLFNKEEMKILFGQLLTCFDSPEITIKEMHEQWEQFDDCPAGLQALRLAIMHTAPETGKLCDFMKTVNWEEFFLNRLCHICKTENSVASLHIRPEQKKVILNAYTHLQNSFDIHSAYAEIDDNRMTINMSFWRYIILKKAFSFDSPNEFYLGLLEIPSSFILDGANVHKKYELIEEHNSRHIITSTIISLVKTEERYSILQELFYGCQRYRIKECKDAAVRFCLNSSFSSYYRDTALDYILDIFGNEIVFAELLNSVDDSLFESIIRRTKDTYDERLKKEALNRYKNNHSSLLQKQLIAMGSQEAIEEYIALLKSLRLIPDLEDEGRGITEAISSIRDVQLLPFLQELTRLRFSEEFVDGGFHSLYSCLHDAYIQCSRQDSAVVITALNQLKIELTNNDDAQCFCNTILGAIQDEYKKALVKAYSKKDIKDFLQALS